jgi:hypothetical protein
MNPTAWTSTGGSTTTPKPIVLIIPFKTSPIAPLPSGITLTLMIYITGFILYNINPVLPVLLLVLPVAT